MPTTLIDNSYLRQITYPRIENYPQNAQFQHNKALQMADLGQYVRNNKHSDGAWRCSVWGLRAGSEPSDFQSMIVGGHP